VLSIGEAAPFYFNQLDYNTTWDRGPISRIMRQSPDDPIAWRNELAATWTHVLVNPVMLKVWERSAWNDPLITADRVVSFLDTHARLVNVEQNSGLRLYELKPSSSD
jgi:hypothetical protein